MARKVNCEKCNAEMAPATNEEYKRIYHLTDEQLVVLLECDTDLWVCPACGHWQDLD